LQSNSDSDSEKSIYQPSNFLFSALSVGCCSDYQAAGAVLEEVDNLFDTFSVVERVLTHSPQSPYRSLDKDEYGDK
jgi:hypothetical protein